MNTIRTTIADDINRLHELAGQYADEAVTHAKQAGILLLEAKVLMKHGDWLPWLEKHITVSPRQVQRYMQVAQGRPLPIRMEAASKTPRTKSDTVTHSAERAGLDVAAGPDAPPFVPDQATVYAHAAADGSMFLVEPASRHPGFFFVSHLSADDANYDATRRPISAQWVEANLQQFGLQEPAQAAWRVKASAGVLAAMDTFGGDAA